MKQKVQGDDLVREEAEKHMLCFFGPHKVVLHLMESHLFAPAGNPPPPKEPNDIHLLLASLHHSQFCLSPLVYLLP